MNKILAYFRELLATLKRIEAHQARSEKHLERLASTVKGQPHERPAPRIRVDSNIWE